MNKIKKNKNLYSRPSQQEMNDLESLYKSNQIDSLENKARKLVENYPRVSKASGLYLHQFKWTNENLIGSLPKNWNVLVGEQKFPKKINALHYTLGGPYFKKHSKCQGSKYWFKYEKQIFG